MAKTIPHMVRKEIPWQNRAIEIDVKLIRIEKPYFKARSAKKCGLPQNFKNADGIF